MQGIDKRHIRISNELKDIQKNPPINWKVYSTTEDQWICYLTLDNSTPFFGDPIKTIVKFPKDYPYSKPQIIFEDPQRIFHPNIRYDGYICHSMVQKHDITMTIRDRMDYVFQLLSNPNPEDTYNSKAAVLYRDDPTEYHRRAFLTFRGIKIP